MIGDIKFVGADTYVVVNRGGTLERLPYIGWLRKLHLFWLTRNSDLSIAQIRDFCRKYGKEIKPQ